MTTPSLGEARHRLGRRWEELEETVADGTGLRLPSGWAVLVLAFCLGLYLADRKPSRRP